MKKVICIILLAVCIMILPFAWLNRQTRYPLSQPSEAISKIEIVEIEDYSIISKGYFDGIVSKTTINPAEHDSFLSEFYRLRCKESLGPSQECIEGVAIRFTYNDGAFELVSAESGFYCSASEDWSYPAYYFDYSQFYNFVSSQT